uniref:Uncharacterized protein n=1 Tax=Glossina austeni TaxID=7395 RepID=A0A1A9VMW3_GLOAU
MACIRTKDKPPYLSSNLLKVCKEHVPVKVYFADNFKPPWFIMDMTGVIRVLERAYKVWIRTSNLLLEKFKFRFLRIPTPIKLIKSSLENSLQHVKVSSTFFGRRETEFDFP